MPEETPVPGPLFDLPFEETPFAFVDLEMTGLNPKEDRVVEVCIHRTLGLSLVESFSSLVHPGEKVGGASEIHGLDAAALLGAPPFESVLADVERLLDEAVFVAHGARWDVLFLREETARAGKPMPLPFYIDTLNLARRAFARPTYALPALCESLGIPHPNAHRAEADVIALRALFAKCVEQLKPLSARDLWQVRIGEGRARDAILEAAREALASATTVEVTFRPSRRAAEAYVMVLTDVRSGEDPPVVVGYETKSRSRRILRADRIVAIAPYDVSSGKDPG